MTAKVPINETGTASKGIKVARQFCKKTTTTSTTKPKTHVADTTTTKPKSSGTSSGSGTGTKTKSKSGNYTVKKGDSLELIARHSGKSVSAIKKANGMSGELIHPGQSLVVPK